MKKIMKPGRNYFIVNIDEPYAEELYEVIKKGQIAKNEWPEGDISFAEWKAITFGMTDRKIVYAAVNRDGSIHVGKRHAQIIRDMVAEGHDKPIRQTEQGFIDNRGEFWSRRIAKSIAIEAGQISEEHVGVLLSEDLW